MIKVMQSKPPGVSTGFSVGTEVIWIMKNLEALKKSKKKNNKKHVTWTVLQCQQMLTLCFQIMGRATKNIRE